MAEQNNENQSVSLDDYNKLKSDFVAQGEKLSKLEKIFEERQTKTLDKEGILKLLGIEKAPEKPIAEVLGEKFNTLNGTVEALKAELKAKDERIALNDKKAKVREIAKPYNFFDVADVVSVIDYTNDDLEGQVKAIAESKKHWIKPTNLGGSFAGGQGSNRTDLEAKLAEAQKNGDLSSVIALKRQIYEEQKN